MDGVIFFALGLLLGCLFTLSFCLPNIGRILTRALAVIFLGSGVGLLIWGILSIVRDETIRPILGWNVITQANEALAWGGGLIIAGVVTLVLSFLGPRDTRSGSPLV